MKQLTLTLITGVSAALLAGCANGIPECNNQDMDKCGYGTVYSEERTAVGEKKDMAQPAPVVVQPAPVAEPQQPAPAPEPEPELAPEPAPAPEPVDTSIMREAPEPDLTK